MQTYDNSVRSHDAAGNAMGVRFSHPLRTHDGLTTDSTGAFLVGELERLDQTLHMPLTSVSWQKHIKLREDVTIADEISSFTLSQFASAGGAGTGNAIGNGKAWIGKTSNQITGIGVDIAKTPQPLRLWGMEMKYTIPELESAARLGRPVDQQKYEGLKLKHQMDIDEQVFFGDSSTGDTGLVNATGVTVTNLPNGVSGSPKWSTKTADEILADVNLMLTAVWAASAWAIMPSDLMLPTSQFGYISTAKVSQAGNVSILKYILDNNLLTTTRAAQLNIQPQKWCNGAGAGGTIGTNTTTNRAVVYTNEYDRVRYPMTLLQRTPIQYESIYHKTTYFCRLGVLEVVYPETMGFFDGL